MKKIITTAAAVALAAGGLALPAQSASAATSPSSCDYVFLVPHQDDELLTLGMGIREHVNAHGGASVCAVVMTTGITSGVFESTRTNPSFNPDGIAHPELTAAQFTRARDKETWNALLYMGVPSSNIYINGYTTPNTGIARIADVNDGSATQKSKIDSWMSATINYFGQTKPRNFKTMSDKSTDTGDHHAMGTALRYISGSSQKGQVLSARYYREPYRTATVTTTQVKPSAADITALNKANNCFRIWDINNGFWKVGYRSVTALFDANLKDPSSYVHM